MAKKKKSEELTGDQKELLKLADSFYDNGYDEGYAMGMKEDAKKNESESINNRIEVVRINRIEGEGSLKAFVHISLFDTLIIKGIRVINGKKGLFVAMPKEMGKDGKWYSTVRSLSRDFQQVIENIVLEAYVA